MQTLGGTLLVLHAGMLWAFGWLLLCSVSILYWPSVLERFIGFVYWSASFDECYGMRSRKRTLRHTHHGKVSKSLLERTRWSAHSRTHATEHVWNAACFAGWVLWAFGWLLLLGVPILYWNYVLERSIGIMYWNASVRESHWLCLRKRTLRHARNVKALNNIMERTRWSALSAMHTAEHLWNAACFAEWVLWAFGWLLLLGVPILYWNYVLERFSGTMCWDISIGNCHGLQS